MQVRPNQNEFLTVEQLKRNIRNTWKKVDEAHTKKPMSDARAAMKGLALTILDDLEHNHPNFDREEMQAILTGLDLFSDYHAQKDYAGYASYIAPAKGGYLNNGSAYLIAKDELKRMAIEKQKAIKEAIAKGETVEDDIVDYKELSQARKIEALNKFRNYLLVCKPLEELQKAAQKLAADNKARAEEAKARQAELITAEKAQSEVEAIKIEVNDTVAPTVLTEKEALALEAKRKEEEKKAVEAKKLEAYKKITLTADELKELHHDEKKALELFTTMDLAKEINALLAMVKAADLAKPNKKAVSLKGQIHQMNPENTQAKPVTLKHVVPNEHKPSLKNNTVTVNPDNSAKQVPSPLSEKTIAAIHAVNPEHHKQVEAQANHVEPYNQVRDVPNPKGKTLNWVDLSARDRKVFDWAKAGDAYVASSRTKAGVVTKERRASWLVDESHHDEIPSLREKRDIRGQDPARIQARASSIQATNEHYRVEYQRLIEDGLKALYDQDANNVEVYRKAETAKDENKLNELRRAGLLLLVKNGATTYAAINALERVTHYFAPNSEVVMNEYLVKPEAQSFKTQGTHDAPKKWGVAKTIETGYTNVKPAIVNGKKVYEKLPKHLQTAMQPVYVPVAEKRLMENELKSEKDREQGLVWRPKKEAQLNAFDSNELIASEVIKHPAPDTQTSKDFALFQKDNYANAKNRKVAVPGTAALNKTISDVVPQVEPVQSANVEKVAKVEDEALVAHRKLFNESKETKNAAVPNVKVADKTDTRPIHMQITNPKGPGLFSMAKSKDQLRKAAIDKLDKQLQEKMDAQYRSNFAKR